MTSRITWRHKSRGIVLCIGPQSHFAHINRSSTEFYRVLVKAYIGTWSHSACEPEMKPQLIQNILSFFTKTNIREMSAINSINTMSPFPMPVEAFNSSNISHTPCSRIALKPSPRSTLYHTGSTSTPTFVDELSYHDDNDFFLISPKELTTSENLTCVSGLRPCLLPRPQSRAMSDIPKLSLKRQRGGFVLSKRTRLFESSFLHESTGSTLLPEAIAAAQPQTSELKSCLCELSPIPSTPLPSQQSSTTFLSTPPRLVYNQDSSEEISFFRGNSNLLLPIFWFTSKCYPFVRAKFCCSQLSRLLATTICKQPLLLL